MKVALKFTPVVTLTFLTISMLAVSGIANSAQAAWMPFSEFETICKSRIRQEAEKKGLENFKKIVATFQAEPLKAGSHTVSGQERWRLIRGLRGTAIFAKDSNPYVAPKLFDGTDGRSIEILSYVNVAFPYDATNGGQAGFVYLATTKVSTRYASKRARDDRSLRAEDFLVQVDAANPTKNCIRSLDELNSMSVSSAFDQRKFLENHATGEEKRVVEFLTTQENQSLWAPADAADPGPSSR